MNSLYSGDDSLHELGESTEGDSEISLGTSTVLGIFFALALVCALFFGFGYTMGRRSAQAVVSTQGAPPVAVSAGSKPPSGSPANHPPIDGAANNDSPEVGSTAPAAGGSVITSVAVPTVGTPTRDAQASSSAVAAPAKLPVKPPQSSVAASGSTPSASGSFVVQIAAVSHREDADILVSTLERRGYDVAIRQEAQDKLLHVQIGPFANKKDADTMKQRLLAGGYNAIVK